MPLDSGELPMDWLEANVTPLFKKGDRASPSNYRPVSLTAIACKLLEHIIHHHVMAHLETYNILTDHQHGFRKGRSCETQLALTIDDLARSLNSQGQTDMIIMDFSKAFDCVPHQRLLNKIHHYGVRGPLHAWLASFLTRRYQQVILDGSSSQRVKVTSGVPQGTVLGPLLFLLYINDLPENISSTVRLMADDCVMYKQIRSESDCLDLQKDLDILCQWENRWQMKFNSKKCFVMNITDKRNPIQHSYSMQDSVLETVDHHTYLGIEISSKLTWNLHVSNISSKANRTLGLLRRHLHSCKPNIKEIAYKSLVRPKLEFCCSIWDPYHQDQKDQLEAVQRKAARFVMRNYKRDSSVSTMIQQLKWQSLEERRAVSRLTFTYKALHKITAVNLDHLKSSKSSRPTRLNSSAFTLRKLATKKDKYKNSLLPRTSSEWNLLPDHVKSAPSLDAFKAYLQDINIATLIRDSHYD